MGINKWDKVLQSSCKGITTCWCFLSETYLCVLRAMLNKWLVATIWIVLGKAYPLDFSQAVDCVLDSIRGDDVCVVSCDVVLTWVQCEFHIGSQFHDKVVGSLSSNAQHFDHVLAISRSHKFHVLHTHTRTHTHTHTISEWKRWKTITQLDVIKNRIRWGQMREGDREWEKD